MLQIFSPDFFPRNVRRENNTDGMSSDRDWGSEDEDYDSDDEDREYEETQTRGREDDDEGPPKKKRRTGPKSSGKMLELRSLIDDEAEASDDDSDDEEGMEPEFDAGLAFITFVSSHSTEFIVASGEADAAEGAYNHRRHLGSHLTKENERTEEWARQFTRRFAESEKVMEEYAEEEDSRMPIAQQARQPSTKDPKLWLVKCVVSHQSCLFLTFSARFREASTFLLVAKSPHAQGRGSSSADYFCRYPRSFERTPLRRGLQRGTHP